MRCFKIASITRPTETAFRSLQNLAIQVDDRAISATERCSNRNEYRKRKMDLGNGLGHSTYSTLVHPADNWEQLYNSLVTYLPKVKAWFAGNKPFGVCIRLSAASAETLANSPAERAKLKQSLDDNDMYIYTANAFVDGHFKGDKVKEQVYEPDWRGEERTQYTISRQRARRRCRPASRRRSRVRRWVSSRGSPATT